jgi:hypothetical protein
MRLAFCAKADRDVVQQRVDRVGRMLNGLIASIQTWDEPEDD